VEIFKVGKKNNESAKVRREGKSAVALSLNRERPRSKEALKSETLGFDFLVLVDTTSQRRIEVEMSKERGSRTASEDVGTL